MVEIPPPNPSLHPSPQPPSNPHSSPPIPIPAHPTHLQPINLHKVHLLLTDPHLPPGPELIKLHQVRTLPVHQVPVFIQQVSVLFGDVVSGEKGGFEEGVGGVGRGEKTDFC